MVKVEVSDKKGLVQYAGQDGFHVVDPDGITVKSAEMSAQLKIISSTKTLADDTTAHVFTDLIPAGTVVLCGEVAVETASSGGNTFNITKVGVASALDLFSGTIALAANEVGSQVLSPNGMMAAARDNSDASVSVTVTTADPGTQTTDGIIRLSLFCAQADTTGQTI
jgi:hypothetical protein